MLGDVAIVQIGVRGLDRQLAAVRHGVARVDGEIEDRVLELVGIGVDAPQAGRSTVSMRIVSPSVRCSSSDMPDTSLLASTGSGASGCWRAKASSRWVSDAARRAPSCAPVRYCSIAVTPRARRRSGEIEIAEHDRQHVVEVVRDAAGQLADRLHLLRLPQRFLGLLALGHFVDQLVGAVRNHLLERAGQAAQVVDRLVALAFALGEIAGGRRDGAPDLVDFGNRQRARRDRLAASELRGFAPPAYASSGRACPDQVGDQKRDERSTQHRAP